MGQALRGCNKGVCWAAFSFGGIIGEDPASDSLKLWENSFPLNYRTESPGFLPFVS